MKYREYYLDGLRGWAAVIVVIFHMSWEIFGNYFPIYRHYLLRFFLDGKLAVYLFFIISGQSLATSYLRTSNNYYFARMVTVRYLRLSLPIFFSCFLVYILMRFGFTYGNEAGSIVSRSDWLGIFIKFEPEFWRVIKYSFSDVFFKHSTETSYNPFLWTMSIELAGSFFLFATLPILKYLKNRIAFALSAALYLFLSDSIYAMFFIGLFFALLRVDSNFIQKIRFKNFLGLLILLLVVAYDNNLWRMHGNYDDYTNRVMSIMAIYLLFAILLSQKMQKIFTMSLSKFLGKISFALYLVQFPVIMSYTSYLILFFNEKYSYISFAQANFIIFSSVGLSVIFAIPFASLEVLLINKINDLVGRYLLTYEGA